MINTRHLLAQLNAQIIADDGDTLTIQVLPDMPEATVQVKRSGLRAWCIRRLETRATHKGKGIRGTGGGPSIGGLPKHIA